MAIAVQLVSLLRCRRPQYVPTFTLLSRIFPISPPLTSSPVHRQSHAPNSASSVIVQSPYSRPPKNRNNDPFSSQLSRLHWWYSAGLFPTGFFAISVLCWSRVRAYVFPHFEEGSRCSLNPLSLAQFWNLFYFYFIIGGSFFQFWTM